MQQCTISVLHGIKSFFLAYDYPGSGPKDPVGGRLLTHGLAQHFQKTYYVTYCSKVSN